MLKNNDFGHDADDIRTERVDLTSKNIDTFAVELGITGALLAWAQACYDSFNAAVVEAGIEAGEAKDEAQFLADKFIVYKAYYQQSKDILLSLLERFKTDLPLLSAYGIDKPTPRTYDKLTPAVDKMIDKHDELVLAGDPRVLPQAIIDQLTTYRDVFLVEREKSGKEKRESDQAYASQHSMFDLDTENFKFIFNMACMVFGKDDPRLLDLGFVPASEVWTTSNPPAPKNLSFDEPSQTTSWDAVSGDSITYQLDARLVGASGSWERIYEGSATSTTASPSESGAYNLRVRAVENDNLGAHSSEILANFEGGGVVPATPPNPKFVNDMASKRWGWSVDPSPDPDVVEYEFETQLDGGAWKQLYAGPKNYVPAELVSGMVSMRARCKNSAGIYSDWTVPVSISFSELPPFSVNQAIISHAAGSGMYHIDWSWTECVGSGVYYTPTIYSPGGSDPYDEWVFGLSWVRDAELFGHDDLTELSCEIVAYDDGAGWSRVSFTVSVEVT